LENQGKRDGPGKKSYPGCEGVYYLLKKGGKIVTLRGVKRSTETERRTHQREKKNFLQYGGATTKKTSFRKLQIGGKSQGVAMEEREEGLLSYKYSHSGKSPLWNPDCW